MERCTQRFRGRTLRAISLCSLEAIEHGDSILATIPVPQHRPYQVFGIDETPNERLYAKGLADRQTAFQTCDITHEIHWLRLACMACNPPTMTGRIANLLLAQTVPLHSFLPIQAKVSLIKGFGVEVGEPLCRDGIFAVANQELIDQGKPLRVIVGEY